MPRNADHLMQYRFPRKKGGGGRRKKGPLMPGPRKVGIQPSSPPGGGGFGRIAQ